ncbi:hypothetical protein GT568_12865 [Coprococcus sp. BIOML-A1]|uniref:hypothetical protein n=1 Tax=unclassified Coprococcus TaxID=2684943 RepID=UPI0013688598|nr:MULTISPECIES: hypothetical protein [unclassified Coprococcus]MZK39714.1 hypothetical protein [Coprococcus sp. BIOML-A1]MZK63607.1 hypothetical protein [Coprococcus sp. BIOML-A2]
MLKSTFLHKLKQDRVLRIDDYIISYKPAEISRCDTEELYRFKNIDDLFENGMLGSESLKDKLAGADMAIFHKDYGDIITIDDGSIMFSPYGDYDEMDEQEIRSLWMEVYQDAGDEEHIYFLNFDIMPSEHVQDIFIDDLKTAGYIVGDRQRSLVGSLEQSFHCQGSAGEFDIVFNDDEGVFIYSDDPKVIDKLMGWFNRDNS